jgi:hypothetical protein
MISGTQVLEAEITNMKKLIDSIITNHSPEDEPHSTVYSSADNNVVVMSLTISKYILALCNGMIRHQSELEAEIKSMANIMLSSEKPELRPTLRSLIAKIEEHDKQLQRWAEYEHQNEWIKRTMEEQSAQADQRKESNG